VRSIAPARIRDQLIADFPACRDGTDGPDRPASLQSSLLPCRYRAGMAFWIVGWCVLAVVVAIAHHRVRVGSAPYPAEVAAFMLRFENELASAHPEVVFLGLVPERFACLLRVDGQETVVGLHEAFRHAEAFPDEFTRMVANLLGEVREIGLGRVADVDFATAATSLLPQVRSKQWLADHGSFGDSGLVHRALNDDLVVVYVIDAPSTMVFVCREHLRRWRKTVDDLHHLAVGNLARRGVAGLPKGGVVGPTVVHSGDGYDAARVLLLEAQEGLLVAVPDRDTLWVGPENGQNLEQLMATTEAIAEQSAHPVSAQVYRLKDGQLAPLPTRS
jgi:hypothetical protein